MNTLKPDIAIVDDAEQAWIKKYRAAISEPPPKPVFRRMVAYLVGMIIGESKKILSRRDSTRIRTRPQPLEEIGIKTTKRKSRYRKLNPWEICCVTLSSGRPIAIPNDVRNRKDRLF